VDPLLALLPRLDGAFAALAAACLQPLAIYILLSGFDDLLLDLVCLKRRLGRPRSEPLPGPGRRIAMMIPCWHEQDVIARMVEHNRAAILYSNYEIFIGAYLNDAATQSVIRSLAARDPQVHLALVPHNGPTVKADCLNWIYQRILEHEDLTGERFDLLLVHDAEDLVHPDELQTLDRYAGRYDMIQVPVLPLATPWTELTHGVYCDDFAESQGKDLESRQALGGFLPGCGVGTGWRREAIEDLARRNSNRLFASDHLTEDYENGLRLHELGYRQIFVPCVSAGGEWRATREYFPRRWSAAVRQRSRWVTGGALQTWEKCGWRGGLARKYFFWRDRKALWGNPVSLLCNLLLLYGLLHPAFRRLPLTPVLQALLWFNAAILAERMLVRMTATARFYGWPFALGVPVRMLWGNAMNFCATCRALGIYFRSRWCRAPLVWMKTEHTYPDRAALLPETSCPGILEQEIPPAVARVFPRELARSLRVLPFRIADGSLDVASPALLGDEVQSELRRFTRLEIRFHLVSPKDFEELAERLL
jgi:bacteriophage N4 adsorption protein B